MSKILDRVIDTLGESVERKINSGQIGADEKEFSTTMAIGEITLMDHGKFQVQVRVVPIGSSEKIEQEDGGEPVIVFNSFLKRVDE